jgi:para-aminobenzoate synthetase
VELAVIVLAENGDSFSWNVVELLPSAREEISVVPACRLRSDPSLLDRAELLVIGPGPTDPRRAGLLDLVHAAVRRNLPTLGVCLGHQAIGVAYGAALRRVAPVHGRVAEVRFGASRLFPGVEGALAAMRYHSLALEDVSPPLRVVARTADGVVMAVEHEQLPLAGVQFHPDSHATPRGRELVSAFFRAVGIGRATATPTRTATATATATDHDPSALSPSAPPPPAATLGTGSAPPRAARSRRAPTPIPIALSSIASLPSFALLGPGFTGAGWRLLAPLDADAGAEDLVLAAFEARAPLRFRAGSRVDGPLAVDVAPARLAAELDPRGHADGVAAIRAAIAAGDVYQVNLTLRARLPAAPGDALLAAALARGTPPYAAWVRLPGGAELVSASPELLLAVDGRRVRSQPMKGTARDAARLAASDKDAAELAMITDLVRNDLTPVCVPGSVRVAHARRVLALPYAAQTVSDVEGVLADGRGPLDALAALHPGGSVTGAPKLAALAAIAALEPSPRGLYCGALGHGDGPRFTASLLIRTAARTGAAAAGGGDEGWIYGVGGGIVIDSDAAAELAEARLKLEALCSPATPPCA